MARKLEVVASGFSLPESPRWHDRWLWFSDIHAGRVHRMDPSGALETVGEFTMPTGLGFLPDGDLLVVDLKEHTVTRMHGSDEVSVLDLGPVVKGASNDMVVDASGRAYIGDPGQTTDQIFEHGGLAPVGQIIFVPPDGPPHIAATGLVVPNGIGILPDGVTLVVAECFGPMQLTAFTIAADGSLADRRTLIQFSDGAPDGLCCDEEGAVWVAVHPRIGATPHPVPPAVRSSGSEFVRVLGGEIVDRIKVTDRWPLACVLGGPDRRTLYCCTAVEPTQGDARVIHTGWIEAATVDVPGRGLALIGPLGGRAVAVRGSGAAAGFASRVLASVGARVEDDASEVIDVDTRDGPALWASSGAMALTGRADGPPLVPDAPLAARVHGLAAVLTMFARWCGATTFAVDGLALLGERAALAGLSRGGRISCGGGTRLLAAADAWIAVTLARPDDHGSVPAWLGVDVDGDVWQVVTDAVAPAPASELVERARLLGLPVARVGEVDPVADPVVVHDVSPAATRAQPLVVDLSSLWAGPLCAQLLGDAGARVVKVESVHRPDGTRRGPPAFYDLLHTGHESVALDFRSEPGRRALAALVAAADVVVEASRPRALEQLGIVADDVRAARPGSVWVSITAYGRSEAVGQRVGFGDDCAAAAGLVVSDGEPLFVADAVADPLAGLLAASGALACLAGGVGGHVDVSLTGAAAALLDGARGPLTCAAGGPAPPPRARPPRGAAAPLGRDTARVLAELGL